jgi:L-lysine 2,3-aminomutase
MFNLNTVLKMLGITPQQMQDMQRTARDAAQKAEESYARLKRIENELETLNKQVMQLATEIKYAERTKYSGGAGGEAGHDPGCRCDYCGKLEWKPNNANT